MLHVHHRPRRRDDLDWPVAAGVVGNLVVGHVEERIIRSRGRHAVGRVHDALRLRIGGAEVRDDLVVADDHSHPNPGGVIRSAIVLHAVLEGILAVGYLPYLFSHPPLGVVHQRGTKPR